MNNEQYYDQIEAYLKGQLNDTERQAFEAQLAQDKDLAAETDFLRDVMLATDPKWNAIESTMKEYFAEKKMPPPTNGRGEAWKKWWWLIAALFVAAALYVFWPKPEETPTPAPIEELPQPEETNSPTPQKPIAETPAYPQPKEEAPQPKNAYLALAKELYKAPEEFSASRKGGEQPSTDNPIARAHALFQTGKYAQAAQAFQALTSEFSYGYDAEWYLLLSYLAQLPEAQFNFDTLMKKMLADKEHPFREKALALKSRMQ
jgi:hypothetical protein